MSQEQEPPGISWRKDDSREIVHKKILSSRTSRPHLTRRSWFGASYPRRKLFNEMLWQAHIMPNHERNFLGRRRRKELRSQWAAARLEFLVIVELLNLITELGKRERERGERERSGEGAIYVRLTFASSPASAIELAVRIIEYVGRDGDFNHEATGRRNNNEINFSARVIWKYARNFR